MTAATEAPRIRHLETGWSSSLLRALDRVLPRSVFNVLAGLGVGVAVLALPRPRRSSRQYLAAVLGRPPSWLDVWRHYWAFTMMHMLRLRVAEGRTHACQPAPGCEAFTTLMASGRPALLGSFHIGNSDLLGFVLGRFNRHIHMIRFRLGNSDVLRQIARQYGAGVTFVWVNERENLLFALKRAVESGGTVVMKCDRIEYSARLETFHFLDARRTFPFTIYHFGILFQRPVTFCVSVPSDSAESIVHGFPVFEPDAASKESNLLRARTHFQDVLTKVETILRSNPYLWFNFASLNPVVVESAAPVSSASSTSSRAILSCPPLHVGRRTDKGSQA